ncbi:hypothetical protein [Streptomyces sp. NPDC051636]|uniref:hypothetical protein n=1 Tax=Streptomyces sp. NPDC051636 TaxID=3365663 RepID=UPI0037B216B0
MTDGATAQYRPSHWPLDISIRNRPAEYAAAVTETRPLASAAAIELTGLTPDDLADYLYCTTRNPDRANPAANAWEPVLAALREQPPDGPASPLATVLATPLMVTLARSIYSDTPGRDPSELLDTERFGSPEELEDHLLGHFIPTVYHRRPEPGRGGRPRRRFTPERARRWLGYLAQDLNRLQTPDLTWWRLGTTRNRYSRMFALGLLTALVAGATTGLGNIAVDVIATSHGLGYVLRRGLVAGLLHGLVAGLGSGILYGAVGDRRAAAPTRLRVQTFGRHRAMRTSFLPRFAVVLGLPAALVLGLVDQVAVSGLGPDDGLGSVLVSTLGAGLGTGLVLGLMAWLEAPVDVSSAAGPADLLNTNRRYVVFPLLVWGLVCGLIHVFTASGIGLTTGFETALGLALGYWFSLTAWGQWVALARIWLPLTGRLPWALIAFLDDACRRGVLRQAGAVYQFRHARLQQHLGRLSGLEPDPVPRRDASGLTPGEGASRTDGRGGRHHLEERGGERRRLVAQLAEHTASGEEVPLQIQIVTSGGSSRAPLRGLRVPPPGAQILITVHAPGLAITGELQQTVTVLPGQDSDVLRFPVRSNVPGLFVVTARAFHHGTFIGEVRCQITVEPGGAIRGGPPTSAELRAPAFGRGELPPQGEDAPDTPPDLEEAEAESTDRDESDAALLPEDAAEAAGTLDSAMARLFVRLGPPPEPSSLDYEPVGSGGGGTQQ